MVGQAASHAVEEVMPLAQGIEKVLVGAYLHPRGFTEPSDVLPVLLRLVHRHCLVRPPRRQDPDPERVLRYIFMVSQVIRRVICGADDLHIEPLHEGLAAEFRSLEHFRAPVIDGPCGARAQYVVYPENPGQLQMGPVVQRVTHGIRDCLGPFLELLVAAAAAGDELLRDTVPSHCTPLVVVSSKPDLGQVLETVVAGYLLRLEVAVIVDDRHLLRTLMVELAGIAIGEHEIVVDELLVDHPVDFPFYIRKYHILSV